MGMEENTGQDPDVTVRFEVETSKLIVEGEPPWKETNFFTLTTSPSIIKLLEQIMIGNLNVEYLNTTISDVVPPPAEEEGTPFSEVIKQNPIEDITITHFPESPDVDPGYFEVHAVHQDDTKTSFATFADKERAEKHRDFRLEQYSVANKTGVSK